MAADYSAWKKAGVVLLPCRVVGLALELLFKAKSEYDLSLVGPEHCASVELWKTQHLGRNQEWSAPQTCRVPVRSAHVQWALYLLRRLYAWISGLGLAVRDAIVTKTRSQGTGHHDLVLKHAGELASGPCHCSGQITVEVKVAVAGKDGRQFRAAWSAQKERCEASLGRVLKLPRTPFGAAVLLVLGICDAADLTANEPPLLVKAQILVLDASGEPTWGRILLDRGTIPVEPAPPPLGGSVWVDPGMKFVQSWLGKSETSMRMML